METVQTFGTAGEGAVDDSLSSLVSTKNAE